MAGLASVPAIVRAYEKQKMLEVALIENLQREDINPVDAANASAASGAPAVKDVVVRLRDRTRAGARKSDAPEV